VSVQRWYTADFDAMAWQGVHVHGLRLVPNDDGTAELVLDIDFLLTRAGEDGAPHFRVAQAILQFHEVSALRMALDYAACSAGMTPFAIGAITRASLADAPEGDDAVDAAPWRWTITIDWPDGELAFDSPGFSQWLVGEPVTQSMPSLLPAHRM
jgi:hypothetical protein